MTTTRARPATGGKYHPSRPRRLLKAAVYGLVFAAPVTALAFVVREKFLPVIELDVAAIRAATDFTRAHQGFYTALVAWQEMTQPKWPYIVASLVCFWIWRQGRYRTRAIWAFVTMMVAWNLQLVLKAIVHRARPVVSDPVSHAPGFSFPSGHAANAAALSAVMVLLLWPMLSRAGRAVSVVLATVYSLVTALDRVYLGVHFPSDVTAGLIFGVGLAIASYTGYLGWNPVHPDADLPPEGAAGPERSAPVKGKL
jgi:membrane-associated phospholipid phosphatase